jgi:hypothetical protein
VLAADAFAVLFCAPGVRGAAADAPAAMLSPSTRGLRGRLAAAGVAFAMPLAPDADAGAHGALAELQECAAALRLRWHNSTQRADAATPRRRYERANPGSTRIYAPTHAAAAGVDGTPASALVVSGTLAVHALFNFLHNFKAADSSRDVPLLLAGAPFEGASIAPLRLAAGARQRLEPVATVGARGAAPGAAAAGAATSTRREMVFTASVRAASGSIPLGPWNIARLCEVLRGSQDGEFGARFDALPLTHAFNLALPLDDTRDGAGGAAGGAGGATSAALPPPPPPPKGGYASEAEREAARAPLGWVDDVMAAVVCQDGMFSLPLGR